MHNMEEFYFEKASSLEEKTSIWEKDMGKSHCIK